MTCELCESAGGELLWRDRTVRVVRVGDPDYPGFCRVIWHTHVKEMTDLSVAERTDDGTTRYHLLETLRQYAREQLDETGAADDWRRRHAEHYAAFAEDVLDRPGDALA